MPGPEKQPASGSADQGYRNARKYYVLVGTALFASTILNPHIEAVSISGVELTLERPDLAPLILCFALLYLAYRTTHEWLESGRRRKTDLTVVHTVGFLSLAIYLADRFSLPIPLVLDPHRPSPLLIIVAWLAGNTIARVYVREAIRDAEAWRGSFWNRVNVAGNMALFIIVTLAAVTGPAATRHAAVSFLASVPLWSWIFRDFWPRRVT